SACVADISAPVNVKGHRQDGPRGRIGIFVWSCHAVPGTQAPPITRACEFADSGASRLGQSEKIGPVTRKNQGLLQDFRHDGGYGKSTLSARKLAHSPRASFP